MKRCPKCTSTLLLESAQIENGLDEHWEKVWKCVGCGREYPVRKPDNQEKKPVQRN